MLFPTFGQFIAHFRGNSVVHFFIQWAPPITNNFRSQNHGERRQRPSPAQRGQDPPLYTWYWRCHSPYLLGRPLRGTRHRLQLRQNVAELTSKRARSRGSTGTRRRGRGVERGTIPWRCIWNGERNIMPRAISGRWAVLGAAHPNSLYFTLFFAGGSQITTASNWTRGVPTITLCASTGPASGSAKRIRYVLRFSHMCVRPGMYSLAI
jgi:hypothetical protein